LNYNFSAKNHLKIGEKSSAATTKYEELGTCVYYN